MELKFGPICHIEVTHCHIQYGLMRSHSTLVQCPSSCLIVGEYYIIKEEEPSEENLFIRHHAELSGHCRTNLPCERLWDVIYNNL
jgi:hypothetical protein